MVGSGEEGGEGAPGFPLETGGRWGRGEVGAPIGVLSQDGWGARGEAGPPSPGMHLRGGGDGAGARGDLPGFAQRRGLGWGRAGVEVSGLVGVFSTGMLGGRLEELGWGAERVRGAGRVRSGSSY